MKRLIWLLVVLIGPASHAGESLFSRTYTTETVPGGGAEVEQLLRSRDGRGFGSYGAIDMRTEFEYGFTDHFQGAFYVNYGYLGAAGAPDDDDPKGAEGFTRSSMYFQGVSLEFIYRLLSPITDPIGVALYAEPEVYFHDPHDGLPYDKTMSTEYRLLLQKNFFNDKLVVALNIIAELEFIRFQGTDGWKGELDWNNELGVSYRVANGWFVGMEARNHNEYADFSRHEHSLLWAGPAIHYANQKLWATVGVMRQIRGWPATTDDGLFLRSHEKWESTLKVGVPL